MGKAKGPIENKIYASIILHCEEMENERTYRGNGHHLAQRLSKMVAEGLLTRQEKKIYDCLPESGKMRARDIAKQIGMSTKMVSSILHRIGEKTLLVHSTSENKRRNLWYK